MNGDLSRDTVAMTKNDRNTVDIVNRKQARSQLAFALRP